MNEQECLDRMVAPGTRRPGKYLEGVIQIHITRACDLQCINCTQGSQLGGKNTFMSPEHFEQAVLSLKGYFGVVGIFGGNPCLSPHFPEYCKILQKHVPFEQRGLWSNHPRGHGKICRETFDPSHSNLNVHLSKEAYDEFKRDWPQCNPVGLIQDSRHSPCYVSMKDIGVPEEKRFELISKCPINQHWSAMVGVFRGQLRGWFCEIAGAQAMLHQSELDYPDTGLDLFNPFHKTHDGPTLSWWQLSMSSFSKQVRKHCHDCGVPMQGHGELAQSKDPDASEQVSETHKGVYKLKAKDRKIKLVTVQSQLGVPLERMTNYLGNSRV